jgi:hypothetical protein
LAARVKVVAVVNEKEGIGLIKTVVKGEES